MERPRTGGDGGRAVTRITVRSIFYVCQRVILRPPRGRSALTEEIVELQGRSALGVNLFDEQQKQSIGPNNPQNSALPDLERSFASLKMTSETRGLLMVVARCCAQNDFEAYGLRSFLHNNVTLRPEAIQIASDKALRRDA